MKSLITAILLAATLAAASTPVTAQQKWVTCVKGFGPNAPVAVFPDRCPYGWRRG